MSKAADAPDVLRQLMRGEWIDPDGGLPVGVPVRTVAIERSLHGLEAELVASLGLGRRLAVVSDATTRAVLGERVERALAALGTVLPIVLAGQPHADADTAANLRRACASADALIAVGSGTINDLCKYAAATDGKPYAVFATAPSMNGYTSTNAAITVDGHKQSLAAAAPAGVFIDLEVLAQAPARMIRAGLGDSLCRSTAQADWLLSHHLLGTPYRRAPFALLAQDESRLLDEPEALFTGDPEAMRGLARTLVLSGHGMTICGGSYPASQGEHLISHYIDMFAPPARASFFHGEQVAVATLTMARIQEAVIAAGPPRLQACVVTARHAAAAVRRGDRRIVLARIRAEVPFRTRRGETLAPHRGRLGRHGSHPAHRHAAGVAACRGAGAGRRSRHASRYRAFTWLLRGRRAQCAVPAQSLHVSRPCRRLRPPRAPVACRLSGSR